MDVEPSVEVGDPLALQLVQRPAFDRGLIEVPTTSVTPWKILGRPIGKANGNPDGTIPIPPAKPCRLRVDLNIVYPIEGGRLSGNPIVGSESGGVVIQNV